MAGVHSRVFTNFSTMTIPNPARKTMLWALGILFVSEFLQYANFFPIADHKIYNGGNTYLEHSDSQWNTYIGWVVNPSAMFLIPVLLLIYLTKIHQTSLWSKWGYIASILLIYPCISYGGNEFLGRELGLGAWLLDCYAAYQNWKFGETPPQM